MLSKQGGGERCFDIDTKFGGGGLSIFLSFQNYFFIIFYLNLKYCVVNYFIFHF